MSMFSQGGGEPGSSGAASDAPAADNGHMRDVLVGLMKEPEVRGIVRMFAPDSDEQVLDDVAEFIMGCSPEDFSNTMQGSTKLHELAEQGLSSGTMDQAQLQASALQVMESADAIQ